MKLYLSSYKLGNKTEELKKWIKEHGNKIILIPNSRDVFEDGPRKEEGIKREINSLEELGFEVKNLSLKDYFGEYEKLKRDLEGNYAFYVIGGNTYYKSDHPESKMIDDVVEYLKQKNIKFKTLQDGDVILEELQTKKK